MYLTQDRIMNTELYTERLNDMIAQYAEFMIQNPVQILAGYSVAAEPPVRRGESHLSGLTEPPLFSVYSYCA